MKDASIIEGGLARKFNMVQKLKISRTDGGLQEWIPQNEAGEYINTKDKTITENGTYIARNDNCDAYKTVDVKFPIDRKFILQDGTYRAADDNLDGYSGVSVTVSHRVGDKKITEDGVYNAIDDGFEGYEFVTVEVNRHIGKPTIQENGRYVASEAGYDYYEEVTVDVQDEPSTYPSGREVTGIAERDLKDFETVVVDTSGESNTIDYATQYPRSGSGKLLGVMKGSCDEGEEGTVVVLFE